MLNFPTQTVHLNQNLTSENPDSLCHHQKKKSKDEEMMISIKKKIIFFKFLAWVQRIDVSRGKTKQEINADFMLQIRFFRKQRLRWS